MVKKRILYVTDLDGTLLRSNQTVSSFTADTIRKLTENGMLFSYATARSYTTARKVTEGLPEKLPVIVFNGSFIVETGTGKRLLSNIFAKQEITEILDFLISHKIYPIVHAFFGESEKFSYVREKENDGINRFLQTHKDDIRKHSVSCLKQLYDGEIFHITCIDAEEKLRPVYNYFKETYPSVLYRDMYSKDTWLEIHPKGATKANAVLTLKKMLSCDELICFGDGKNDISMFQAADACYAVANAEESLKAIATDIIGSNEEDGVAKWLSKYAKLFSEKHS